MFGLSYKGSGMMGIMSETQSSGLFSGLYRMAAPKSFEEAFSAAGKSFAWNTTAFLDNFLMFNTFLKSVENVVALLPSQGGGGGSQPP